MERGLSSSGPGACPLLDASGNGELEKAVKCSTGARRRGVKLRLHEEPKGEEPGEQQNTEI